MSAILEVEHVTHYRYAKPVRFGEHRLMFRPRAGHDIQVLDSDVAVKYPVAHRLDARHAVELGHAGQARDFRRRTEN